MKVLVACEFSGRVRDAFIARGHDAWSCDLEPTETPGPHIRDDVRRVLREGWDLMVAHPPCRFLANSGIRWLKNNPSRWVQMQIAADFFRYLLDAPIPRIAVENPIPHRHALAIIGRRYDQIIQPWQFGHGETKATCLWLKGLAPLTPTVVVEGRERRVHRAPDTKDRAKMRSRTYPGIAAAMAEQWGQVT